MSASPSSRMPTYFLSHGGGPWPWMEGAAAPYRKLAQSLAALPAELPAKPRAVLMVSGHWESHDYALMTSPKPGMVYDYYGFPAHTYSVVYPAPGDPALAEQVMGLLRGAGLPTHADAEQGFDHGSFVPMACIYPQADVPVVQLALSQRFDPAEHLAVGRALAPLRDEGVLILGSGLSYHNLRAFGPAARPASAAFDAWLQDSLLKQPPAVRSQRLVDWTAAPAARAAHPREEHLLPLMVALGAAEAETAVCTYHEDDFMGGVVVSSFRFGDAAAA